MIGSPNTRAVISLTAGDRLQQPRRGRMANMVSLKLEHAIGGEQPQDAMQSIRMCTDGCRQFCRRSRPVAERIGDAAAGYDMQAP